MNNYVTFFDDNVEIEKQNIFLNDKVEVSKDFFEASRLIATMDLHDTTFPLPKKIFRQKNSWMVG